MQRTNIYLDDEQVQALDRLAADEGVSRAEIIRRLLDRSLIGEDRDLTADLQSIDDSFGALHDANRMLERAPDGRSSHIDDVWSRTA